MWIIEDNILVDWTSYDYQKYKTEEEAQIALATYVLLSNETFMLRIVEAK